MTEFLAPASTEHSKPSRSRAVILGLISLSLTAACSSGGGDEAEGGYRKLTAQEVSTAQANLRRGMTPAQRFNYDYLDEGATQVDVGKDTGEAPNPTGGCLARTAWSTTEPDRYTPGDRATEVYDPTKKMITIYLPNTATDPHNAAEFVGFDDVDHVLKPHNEAAINAVSTFCTQVAIEHTPR